MGLMNPYNGLLLSLLLILLLSRGLGLLFKKFKISSMVGEVIGGLLLSPLVIGVLDERSDIQTISGFAVIVIMFHSGLHTDFSSFRKHRWSSIVIGALGVFFTFSLVFIVALFVFSLNLETSLFMGAIISNSAIEVSSALLLTTRFKKLRTLVVGASFVDDILAVFMLGVVLSFVKTPHSTVLPFIGELEGPVLSGLSLLFISIKVGAFLVLTSFVFNKISHKVMDRFVHRGFEVLLSIGFLLAFGLGLLAKWVGLNEIIGVYLAGLILSSWGVVPDPMMNRGVAFMKFKRFFNKMMESLFSPIFFGFVGIMLGSALVHEGGGSVLYILLGSLVFLFFALSGKLLGCGLGARLKGIAPAGAMLIGVSMWGRGALELVLARSGMNEGILAQDGFSIVVIMTLLTILITPLAYRLTFKWKEDQLDDAGL